jgi:S-adenosylmethionine:tRNA ribosyltransferase-isomerase
MHSEYYYVREETAIAVNKVKSVANGPGDRAKVVCVGTTSLRTLESVSSDGGVIKRSEGWTDIFIYPGYRFKCADSLLTNFHLPGSTLIMLVCAFAGYDLAMEAYRRAVEAEYRFFSFGDAMLIL